MGDERRRLAKIPDEILASRKRHCKVFYAERSMKPSALTGAVGRDFRVLYSWYGDMDLAFPLWQFLAFGKVTIEIVVHLLVMQAAASGSRKELSRMREARIVRGYQADLHGLYQGAAIELIDGDLSGELLAVRRVRSFRKFFDCLVRIDSSALGRFAV